MLVSALDRMVARSLARDLGWFVVAAAGMLANGASLWGLVAFPALVIYWRKVTRDLSARAGLRRLSRDADDIRRRLTREPNLWLNEREWNLLRLTAR